MCSSRMPFSQCPNCNAVVHRYKPPCKVDRLPQCGSDLSPWNWSTVKVSDGGLSMPTTLDHPQRENRGRSASRPACGLEVTANSIGFSGRLSCVGETDCNPFATLHILTGSARLRKQDAFVHSDLNDPLNDSMKALSVGFPAGRSRASRVEPGPQIERLADELGPVVQADRLRCAVDASDRSNVSTMSGPR